MYFDTTNPRYQRAIQIMSRWNPRQKAIFSSVMADREFARSEIGKQIQLLDMARRKKVDMANLQLSKKRLKLGKKQVSREKTLSDVATMMGIGDIGLKTWLGSKALKNRMRWADLINQDMLKYFGQ